MTWLLGGTDTSGELLERHFCRGCAPSGPVADVVCVRCGDGRCWPVNWPAPVRGWLSAAGWQASGPVCPGCVGELGR